MPRQFYPVLVSVHFLAERDRSQATHDADVKVSLKALFYWGNSHRLRVYVGYSLNNGERRYRFEAIAKDTPSI